MQKPDSRVFASYPMPAKIDLLNERPRRESLVERQLEDRIGQISPMIQVSSEDHGVATASENQIINTTTTTNMTSNQQNNHENWGRASPRVNNVATTASSSSSSISPNTEIRETRLVINQHSSPASHCNGGQAVGPMVGGQGSESFIQQQQQQQKRQQYVESQPRNEANNSMQKATTTTTKTTTTTTTTLDNKTILANELAQKEAKLMREIESLNQRPYSPYGQTPGKVELMVSSERMMSSPMMQQNVTSGGGGGGGGPSPRPHSSASSTTGQDLLEKEASLLRQIEEIESKPFNPQTMIVEREQWYEYPQDRPSEKHLTESRRRVRDFCSMPSELCQDRHIHEENIPIKSQPSPTPGSIQTTIIRSPRREIDNKSPLPFAFDNFSTKGIRGNIASVGAVEPDRPRPPIYPIVKRTPSPGFY